MPSNRYKPEEIVAKLRQVDVLTARRQNMANAISQIGVSEVPEGRTAQRRDLLHATRSPDRHRKLAPSLQRRSAPCFARLQAISTGGIHVRLNRMGHYTNHPGATTGAKLTSRLGHPMWVAQELRLDDLTRFWKRSSLWL